MKNSKKIIQAAVTAAILSSASVNAQAGMVDFAKAHPVMTAVAVTAVATTVASVAIPVAASYAYVVPAAGCKALPLAEMGVCEVASYGLGLRALGSAAMVSGIKAAAPYLSATSAFFSETYRTVSSTFSEAGKTAVDAASTWYNTAAASASSGYNSAVDVAFSGYNAAVASASSGYNSVADVAFSGYNAAVDAASTWYNTTTGAASTWYEATSQAVSDTPAFVAQKISNNYDQVAETFTNLPLASQMVLINEGRNLVAKGFSKALVALKQKAGFGGEKKMVDAQSQSSSTVEK